MFGKVDTTETYHFLLHGLPPRWGEVLPLVLGLHGDDGPSGILLHGLR